MSKLKLAERDGGGLLFHFSNGEDTAQVGIGYNEAVELCQVMMKTLVEQNEKLKLIEKSGMIVVPGNATIN